MLVGESYFFKLLRWRLSEFMLVWGSLTSVYIVLECSLDLYSYGEVLLHNTLLYSFPEIISWGGIVLHDTPVLE